jgi:hypothetical protein
MPIDSFREVPRDVREWSRFFRETEVAPSAESVGQIELKDGGVVTAKLADDAVTNAKLADAQPLSVIGNPANTAGNPTYVTAASNGTYFRRKGNILEFAAIDDADIPASIARDAEVTAAVSAHEGLPDPHPGYTTAAELAAAIAAHEGAGNPHPTYLTQAEGDALYVPLADVLDGTATYDPPDLATGATAITTVTVSGAVAGDFALASHSDVSTTDADKVHLSAKVTATNTVTVIFRNNHTGNVDLASGTLRARVWKQ